MRLKMTDDQVVDVTVDGTVLLGPDVACDGFHYPSLGRVKSHIHLDHMNKFDSSKQFQDIYLSPGTYELLVQSRNADIPYRDNIINVYYETPIMVGESEVSLISSGHMLGAAQTEVCLPDGTTVGYSGDFAWPLDKVIKVDILVIDCTNGNPEKKCKYTRSDAEILLAELVLRKIKEGSVSLVAHSGTIQHVLAVLDRDIRVPIVASKDTCLESEIYRKYGYAIPEIVCQDSKEGKSLIDTNRYIQVYSTFWAGEREPFDYSCGCKIVLSSYMSDPNDPVLEYSDRSYRVALSNHADFEGILKYVKASGASLVVTDNSRGGHGVELANEIRHHLNIDARPSTSISSRLWGD